MLTRLHDLSSRGLFMASEAALSAAVSLYLFEVIARYIFDAPTTWSGEIVQYCLSAIIFLALPEITRQHGHIVIDIVPSALSGMWAAFLKRSNAAAAGLACSMAGAIVSFEAYKQFARGLMTNAALPIPRWWITSIIAVGLISTALHFLRHAIAREKVVA